MRNDGTLGPVATIALLTERMVDEMRGDHQTAACHRHGHLGRVRGEAIAEISSRKMSPRPPTIKPNTRKRRCFRYPLTIAMQPMAATIAARTR